jgi:hypothetical protein
MKVYDETKSYELTVYDLEQGKLIPDKLFIAHHPEQAEIPSVKHREVKRFPNGGASAEWVIDIPAVPAKPAWDEYEDILVYVHFTTEEMEAKRADEIKARLAELSNDFVQVWAGAIISDIEDRKRQFIELHNELRGILGKVPRTYL